MRKRAPQKPRQEYIYGTTKGIVTEIEFSVDPRTGELEFSQDMISTYTQISYERSKGEKVLSPVDTSTSVYDGTEFCVTVIVDAHGLCTVGSNGIARFCSGIPFCFLYSRPQGNAETLGWCLLIDELLSRNAHRRCPSIGIVVDSELGRIKEINARQVPIRELGTTLPANMTIIYAADAASESYVNGLIRQADAATKLVRDYVLAGKTAVPILPTKVTVWNSTAL